MSTTFQLLLGVGAGAGEREGLPLIRSAGQDSAPAGAAPGWDVGLSLTGVALSHQVFHCVHFECPEQQSSQKEENSEELGAGDTSPASQQLEPRALQAPSGSSLPPSPGSNSRSSSRQHQ